MDNQNNYNGFNQQPSQPMPSQQPMPGQQPSQPMGGQVYGGVQQQPVQPQYPQQPVQPMGAPVYGQPMQPQKKNNTVLIVVLVLVGLFIVVPFVFGFIKGFTGALSHKNTTGSSKYKDSDVTYNCSYEETTSTGAKAVYNTDLLFNHEGYQLYAYTKIEVTATKDITDEQYATLVKGANSSKCVLNANECKASHLELGITKYGWDTVIDRSGKKVTITYYGVYGKGYKATKSDEEKSVKTYTDQGYKCK